jgi:hypothetical protein
MTRRAAVRYRHRLHWGAGALALSIFSPEAHAAHAWRTRPIRMPVSYRAGGANDRLAPSLAT